MARLVIVSNRVTVPRTRPTEAGGLAVAMRDAVRARGGLWFGWSGEVADETSAAPKMEKAGKVEYATIDLGSDDYNEYYKGFANSTLWPLLHYRVGLLEYSRAHFDGYRRVNATFARLLHPLLRKDDLIWVHDYHLIPLAGELRKLGVRNPIGFFLHTPFPVAALMEVLPPARELLAEMTAYDLAGFQTESDLRAFEECIMRFADGRARSDRVEAFGRRLRTGVFPVGINTREFASLAAAATGSAETVRLEESLGNKLLIIGADRLDYSKGLPNRFAAYDRLLERWPHQRARVTLLQVAPRSRSDVEQYKVLRHELERSAGRINAKYAEFDWTPVRYLGRSLQRRVLAGFYRVARVGLVTPLRDGMNLVAKEYVAAQNPEDPGVLVLSRFAGAAAEMEGALIVNPYDIDAIAEALQQALDMPIGERRDRWGTMMTPLLANTARRWQDHFTGALESALVN